MGSEDEGAPQFCCSFGVCRTPLLWIDKSLSVVHPFDCLHAVPDDMTRVILEPSQIARERAATLKQWTQWARELAADEKKLFAQLDAGVANVLKGKRLLLLERIANSIGWPDTRLFAEMRAGFMIVGMQEPSGIFGLEPRPASYSVDELCSASKFLRPALLGKVRSAEDRSYGRSRSTKRPTRSGWLDHSMSMRFVLAMENTGFQREGLEFVRARVTRSS